jgi:phosphoglucosamine mutase
MSATRKLFGTDGIRGVANVHPMTAEVALQLGRALAHVIKYGPGRHRIVVGKDTRLSGYLLEYAITAGICSMGVDVLLLGPIPTPGIAYITHSMRADAGVVISASHNSYEDNGIKFFKGDGFKLPDEIEAHIESLLAQEEFEEARPTATEIGQAFRIDDARGRYISYLKGTFPKNLELDGLKIVVDCAHGATYRVAPEVLVELGAEVIPIGVRPNGRNINRLCGATHPEGLARLVVRQKADLGVAFDGDGDRIGVLDGRGRIVWGDQLMLFFARDILKQRPGATIIADVKASQVLFDEIARAGGKPLMWKTGHSLIKTKMAELGAPFAGEMSAHIFFADRYYGFDDALYAAVRLLGILGGSSESLATFRDGLPRVVNTPEIRFPCAEDRKSAVIDEVRARLVAEGADMSEIDGVRVRTADGWWLLRASNTQDVLVARCEAADEAGLARLAATLTAQLAASGLKAPKF